MGSELDRCAICNGQRQEHTPATRHKFTTTPGDLRPATPSSTVGGPPASRPNEVTERLIGLLIEKELITETEALRCLGVDPKRNRLSLSQPLSDSASESAMQLAIDFGMRGG